MSKFAVSIIAGPTASGKSALALARAQEQNGVIINADSLQLYDGLPTLTAQPSDADKESVPHLLYGVLAPDVMLTAMDWRRMAIEAIYQVQADGKVPILVGGTGFYIKTLINGLSPIPEIPNEVRVLSEDLMETIGIEEFFQQLKSLDPVIAERIDPHNRQRLVRAYEVYAHTGNPLSYWQSLPPLDVPMDMDFQVEVVLPERDVLYERCNARFDVMINHGVIDEVRDFDDRMMAGKIPVDCALSHALGFQPLQSYVRGEMDLESAIYLSKNETRHYAKRQVTWFRHQLKK